jgi:hypothetical protein
MIQQYDSIENNQLENNQFNTLPYNMEITIIGTSYVGLVTGAAMKTRVVFDGRNLYCRAVVGEAGFIFTE